jgi:hypothetical protein
LVEYPAHPLSHKLLELFLDQGRWDDLEQTGALEAHGNPAEAAVVRARQREKVPAFHPVSASSAGRPAPAL